MITWREVGQELLCWHHLAPPQYGTWEALAPQPPALHFQFIDQYTSTLDWWVTQASLSQVFILRVKRLKGNTIM